jgi:phosphoribosyl 1,2-cyclic phosphodiesterase
MIPHNAIQREPDRDHPRFLVRYWGVRGSIATPGASTVRYGGNTTCLEIVCDDARFILDMGTGARVLGAALMRDAPADGVTATVLFSHFHSDHVIGFPFFGPLFDPRTRLVIYANAEDHVASLDGLRRVMSYPLFPVEYDTLPASLEIRGVTPGEAFVVAGVTIETCRLRHPGGALAYRITHRGRTFVHASDVEHVGDASDPALVALCRGSDWVSYDAMFVEGDEYECHRGWGHSTWQAAVRLLTEAGGGRLIVTHHAPEHDDRFMDQVAHDVAAARPGSLVAVEGLEIDLLADDARPPQAWAAEQQRE